MWLLQVLLVLCSHESSFVLVKSIILVAFSLLVNKPVLYFIYSEESHCHMPVTYASIVVTFHSYFDSGSSGCNVRLGST
jgi:hypothetical protein